MIRRARTSHANRQRKHKSLYSDTNRTREKRYAAKTVEAFGVSKASVYSYVKELEADGIILKNGNREYTLASESFSFHYKTADHPDESRLLRRDVSPLMNSLPLNVRDIWDYAVSEMLNNAIEHASAENIHLTVMMDALNTTVSITDDGVGIFRHIHDYILRETGEDLLPEECASLLLAGKFTTARIVIPERGSSLPPT